MEGEPTRVEDGELKRNRKEPKLTLASVVTDLREQGFKPNFKAGELIDWRRVKGHHLQTAKVIVHPSGRVTINQRSTANGKREPNPSRHTDTET
jgi:hypothetical protein